MVALLRAVLHWIWSPEQTPLGCLSNAEIDRLEPEEGEPEEEPHGPA